MNNNKKRIQVATLGCSKNKVDSEHLLVQLEGAGYEIVPETEDITEVGADILIINTCGFINDAKEESIQAILEGVQAKEEGHISELLVFGCLSQRYKSELMEEIPQVDRDSGAYDLDSMLKYLGVKKDSELLTRRLLTTPKHYAYLKISEGCDRQCSYCAIPGIRGPHLSVPTE